MHPVSFREFHLEEHKVVENLIRPLRNFVISTFYLVIFETKHLTPHRTLFHTANDIELHSMSG